MPKYTFQAGAHWPNSLIDLTNYQNPSDAVVQIINQIKQYQSIGNYSAANELIQQYTEQLKNCSFDSAAINKYVEEIRNLEIYTKAKKQQIFYGAESEASTYLEQDDVWIGNTSQINGQVTGKGEAIQSDVLSGITFSSENGDGLVGTMPNIGAVQEQILVGQTYIVPQGYHDGSGTITAVSSSSNSVERSGMVDLGKFVTNGDYGVEGEIDVSEYSNVKFQIDVPTYQTGEIELKAKKSTTVQVTRPINKLIYIYGYTQVNGTTKFTIFKGKRVDNVWMTSTLTKNAGETTTILDIQENSFTVKWGASTNTTAYYCVL